MTRGGEKASQMTMIKSWIITKAPQISSCDLGLIKLGRRADFFPALNIRLMRFVLVSRALYTTEKHRPMPAFWAPQITVVGFCTRTNVWGGGQIDRQMGIDRHSDTRAQKGNKQVIVNEKCTLKAPARLFNINFYLPFRSTWECQSGGRSRALDQRLSLRECRCSGQRWWSQKPSRECRSTRRWSLRWTKCCQAACTPLPNDDDDDKLQK